MINLNTIKKYISTDKISFLIDFDKTINIDKSGKTHYFSIFQMNLDLINNFILNLQKDKIYLIQPMISINRRIDDPYLTLSRQFLITNESNCFIVHDFIFEKLEKAENDFNFNLCNYFLILKYKTVYLDNRIFSKN
jgi:hypothetical protein